MDKALYYNWQRLYNALILARDIQAETIQFMGAEMAGVREVTIVRYTPSGVVVTCAHVANGVQENTVTYGPYISTSDAADILSVLLPRAVFAMNFA